jgi:hypothetical protein
MNVGCRGPLAFTCRVVIVLLIGVGGGQGGTDIREPCRMGWRRYRDARRHFHYVEGDVVDRTLDEGTQSILRMLPGQPTVTSTGFAASVDWEDRTREMDAFVERTFDAWLYFDNDGPREVGFRVPKKVLPVRVVRPHCRPSAPSGLAAETREDDLLLRFRFHAEDSFTLGETAEGWLHHILPVREELLSGNMDALELGRLIGKYGYQVDGEPDLPAEYGLSKASRILAAYLLIDPPVLERWSSERTETRTAKPFPDWLTDRADLTPVARWEFAAADPGQSFQIWLGRLPEGCEYGSWYVTATEPRGKPLAFRTEDEARRATTTKRYDCNDSTIQADGASWTPTNRANDIFDDPRRSAAR